MAMYNNKYNNMDNVYNIHYMLVYLIRLNSYEN